MDETKVLCAERFVGPPDPRKTLVFIVVDTSSQSAALRVMEIEALMAPSEAQLVIGLSAAMDTISLSPSPKVLQEVDGREINRLLVCMFNAVPAVVFVADEYRLQATYEEKLSYQVSRFLGPGRQTTRVQHIRSMNHRGTKGKGR